MKRRIPKIEELQKLGGEQIASRLPDKVRRAVSIIHETYGNQPWPRSGPDMALGAALRIFDLLEIAEVEK